MAKALTTRERASRQRIMMRLRKWMEQNDIPRQQVAAEMGITRGHLSTLINANRTPSEEQCQKAEAIMGTPGQWTESRSPKPAPKKKATEKKKSKSRRTRKTNNLRPLTKFETEFVTDVAKAWIKANKNSSQDEFVEVVRALSIGIRS